MKSELIIAHEFLLGLEILPLRQKLHSANALEIARHKKSAGLWQARTHVLSQPC
jgi:O-acetylhomoserine/O-acetylserine sulfhydrylase-like pyridoxal-dependent enzyme